MLRILNSRTAAVLAGAIAVAGASGTAGAVAGGLITSAGIKNHTIGQADMDQGSIGSRQIADKTLARKDLRPRVSDLIAADGVGGFTGYSVHEMQRTVAAGDNAGGEVGCDKGKTILGGGLDSSDPGVIMQTSMPNPDQHDGWVYAVRNTTGSSKVITIVAICADVGTASAETAR